MLAEVSLASFEINKIGGIILQEQQAIASMQNNFSTFLGSYSELFKAIEISGIPADTYSANLLSEMPSVEYFNEVDLLRTITPQAEIDTELSDTLDSTRIDISQDIEESLPSLLAKLDKDFPRMLEGAKDALKSNSVDKVRQFSISLRELFTHVIHKVAPDDEIKAWNKDPEFYHNNKPKRKARILYVCRHINHNQFETFLKKDVNSTIEFLDLIQEGTHAVVAGYTPVQLRSMLVKMEGLLKFIIEVWQTN